MKMEENNSRNSFNYEWNNFSLVCWHLFEKSSKSFTECKKKKFKDVIKNASNNRNRIELVMQEKNICDYLENQTTYFASKIDFSYEKDNSFCKQCKITGDVQFDKKNYSKALKYYSKAILFFDHDYLKTDYNSFSLNLSDLYILRGQTLEKLELYSESKLDFLEALNLNPNCLDDNLKENILLNKSKKDIVELESNFFNPNLEGSTSGVSMSFSNEKGRQIFSNRDIEEGEILFKEEPYVHWLRPSFYEFYCNHCLNKLLKYQFVPCNVCINVRYCSTKCKDIAWSRYHKIECRYLNLLKNWPLGHMGLRLMLRDGLDYVFEEDDKEKISLKDWPKKKFTANYSCIKSLIGEDNFTDADNYCPLVVGCVMIAILLVKTNLIKQKNLKQFASILLKSLMQILENTFLIYDYDFKPIEKNDIFYISDMQNFFKISSTVTKLGVGLYSSASLISHSCDNNSYKYYFKNTILIVAAKKIPSNSEVNIEYGVHYKMNSLKDRKVYLKNNFAFDCKCTACELKYENIGLALKCFDCKGALICNSDQTNHCLSCEVENVDLTELNSIINKSETLFDHGVELFNQNKMKQAEIELKTCEKIFSQIYFSDSKLQFIKSELSAFYCSNEKYYLAYDYLLQTLTLKEDLYGKNSFESLCCLISLACLVYQNLNYLNQFNEFKKNKNFKTFINKIFKRTKQEMISLNNEKNSLNEFQNKYSSNKWREIFYLYFTKAINLLKFLSKRQINIVNEELIWCLNKLIYLKDELKQ